MTSHTRLVFLDTETTGLDPHRHEVWEAAWAEEHGSIQSVFLDHRVGEIDQHAAKVNNYFDRVREFQHRDLEPNDLVLKKALFGATIVGANPQFDARMLYARWGVELWHYRLFDLGVYAAPVLGYNRPVSLFQIHDDLSNLLEGVYIPSPDHTAGGDVATTRACWELITAIYHDAQDHMPTGRGFIQGRHVQQAITALAPDALGIPA